MPLSPPARHADRIAVRPHDQALRAAFAVVLAVPDVTLFPEAAGISPSGSSLLPPPSGCRSR